MRILAQSGWAIESGVDFEKRIAGVYQSCRRPEGIKAAFDQLQLELSQELALAAGVAISFVLDQNSLWSAIRN